MNGKLTTERIVARLENELSNAENRNRSLLEENEKLREKITALQEAHDTTLNEYRAGLKDIHNLEIKLRSELNNALVVRKKYSDEMGFLLVQSKQDLKGLKTYCSVCGEEIDNNEYYFKNGKTMCKYCTEEMFAEKNG